MLQTEKARSARADGAKKKILVVEDDRTHRAIMQKVLQDCRFETGLAENGYVALARLDAGEHYDLIIMDWDMPGLDGLETVREIRARQAAGELGHVPVIAFTANRSPGDREKCIAAGMDAYLPKSAWMPKWRQTLVDNLQGLLMENFDIRDIAPSPHDMEEDKPSAQVSLDAFDGQMLGETMKILRGEFPVAVDEFLEDAAAYVRDIKTGLGIGDKEKVARGSHPLKSSSRSFGLVALSMLAESINMLARQSLETGGSLEPAAALFPQLQEAYARAEQRLREVVRNAGFN